MSEKIEQTVDRSVRRVLAFGGNVLGNCFPRNVDHKFGRFFRRFLVIFVGQVFGSICWSTFGSTFGHFFGQLFGQMFGQMFGQLFGLIFGQLLVNFLVNFLGKSRLDWPDFFESIPLRLNDFRQFQTRIVIFFFCSTFVDDRKTSFIEKTTPNGISFNGIP